MKNMIRTCMAYLQDWNRKTWLLTKVSACSQKQIKFFRFIFSADGISADSSDSRSNKECRTSKLTLRDEIISWHGWICFTLFSRLKFNCRAVTESYENRRIMDLVRGAGTRFLDIKGKSYHRHGFVVLRSFKRNSAICRRKPSRSGSNIKSIQ